MKHTRYNVSINIIFAIVVLAATRAAASDAPPPGGALEEITVTAQRRSESLQTVPIAITALTPTDIERKAVHDLGSLAGSVPGLTFSPFAPGQNIVSLRGVSSNDDGAGTDNSVAVFVDDVYLGRVSNINPETYDVDRIEVLRGPQGTLYGKNTIGGAINIISSAPDPTGFDAKANVDIGNFGRHNFSGLITGPLGDGWAGKLVVSTRKADGWADNVVLKTKEKDDNSMSVRGQIARRNDSSDILLSADYHQLRDADMARTPLTHMTNNLPFNLLSAYQSLCGTDPNPRCATNPEAGFADQTAWGISAKYTQHLSSTSDITSITAFRHSNNNWNMDSLGAVFPVANDVSDVTKQVSEEIRYVASPSSALHVVAGLWYLREDTDRQRVFLLPAVDTTIEGNDRYRGVNRTTSYAGFGQVDWSFADRWKLTVGGRYSYDRKHIDNDAVHGVNGILLIIPNTFANTREASWSKFTPKISLSYQPSHELNLYASVVQGFKSGGFAASPTSVAETDPLKPESATNVELGAKMELSGSLRANIAMFYTRYKDLQLQAFGPPPNCAAINSCFGVFETFNAGSAEAKGVEAEITWQPIEHFTATLNYGYLDAKFIDLYLPNASVYTTIDGQAIDLRNQSGKDMLRAPRNKGGLELKYDVLLADRGTLEASAGFTYTGAQRGELEPYAIQPAYHLFDARLGWFSPDRRYQVALWGRNLANRAWVAQVYTIANEVLGVYGEPRTYGVSVGWHFRP